MLNLAVDVAIGLWVVALAIAAYVLAPAAALGGTPRRAVFWPERLGGASWATLATIAFVPSLSRLHLLNWASALLIPLAWPMGLWLYRYRGAPASEFRMQARNITLAVLSRRPHASIVASVRRPPPLAIGAIAALGAWVFWPAVHEVRFQTSAEYGTLQAAHDLVHGGHWTVDPAASLVTVLSYIGAVDAMHVLRYLNPLLVCGCVAVAALLVTRLGGIRAAAVTAIAVVVSAAATSGVWDRPSSNGVLGSLFVLIAAALVLAALERVHRRDWWHVVAAGLVAAFAFASRPPDAEVARGYVEYDAAARQALRLTRTIAPGAATIVAPPVQRVEVDPMAFVELGDFVRRYGGATSSTSFRFDLPTSDVYVFVERRPLLVPPTATWAPAFVASAAYEYQSPNARAQLEHTALELCEGYRGTHAQADIYYEDAQLRVYHFRQ